MIQKALLLFIFTLICSVFSLEAQTEPKHELGLRLTSLNDFSVIYYKQADENKYHRFRIGRFGVDAAFGEDNGFFDISLAASYGIEKRREIFENLDFVSGPEFVLGLFADDITDEGDFSMSLGVGYILGFHWHLSEAFYVGIEHIPGISVFIPFSEGDPIQLGLGFNIAAISFKAVHKFGG